MGGIIANLSDQSAFSNQNLYQWSSLVAYWLQFWAFTAVGGIQSVVGELSFRKPRGMAKTNKQKTPKKQRFTKFLSDFFF